MSNQINEQLLERAADMIDYWVGTYMERVLERDIRLNDLHALLKHVNEAEAIASQQEFEYSDIA